MIVVAGIVAKLSSRERIALQFAILEITEWKTDTAARVVRSASWVETIWGGSFWDIDPAASAAQVAQEAFKRKIGELFSAPEIRSALTTASQ